jgi:class 3 adenylate cyclase
MRLDPMKSQPANVLPLPRGTVLFADLRGYVSMAEHLEPPYLASLLDEFFSALTVSVELHGGEVYHTAGDALMAGFGLAEPQADGAHAALEAGRDMLTRFADLAERWRHDSQIQAGLGVGLHLGQVALATFGPPTRRVATLVGDTPNVAARLCSRARAGEVLFSCAVAAALQARTQAQPTAEPGPGMPAFLQLPRYELRGRREPLDIWCVPANRRPLEPVGFELQGAEHWQ